MEDNLNNAALSGESGVNSSDGAGSASKPGSVASVLSQVLGKTFTTDEAALKSVKDTFDAIGKSGKAIAALEAVQAAKGVNADEAAKMIMELTQTPSTETPKIDASQFVSREEFNKAEFYNKPENQKFNTPETRELLETLQKGSGKTLNEVIEMPSFKTLFESAQAQNDRSKSVLHTNPRLGVASDKITKAQDELKAGNADVAKSDAVSAVLEAYEQ